MAGEKTQTSRCLEHVRHLAETIGPRGSATVQESAAAIERDGAHVIIFGCTGMLGYAEQVRQGLERLGHGSVPVIDPVPAAVRLAEALVDLGLSHSKRSYPSPPKKRIVGFDAFEEEPTPA